MMDASTEGAVGIVSGYSALKIDWKVRALGQIVCVDGMEVIATIRLATGPAQVLINVRLRSQIPRILREISRISCESV